MHQALQEIQNILQETHPHISIGESHLFTSDILEIPQGLPEKRVNIRKHEPEKYIRISGPEKVISAVGEPTTQIKIALPGAKEEDLHTIRKKK